MSDGKQRNRLAHETSPYLLQHASNPVDWYPWGDEAIQRARDDEKPIFLSIGYAACHWCHVMERESFEDPAIAELLNRHFVPIKVDREERPDLDEIYMSAVQLMTRQGGWPLSVFLTPELQPFFGGTYFPPQDRWGRPGFSTVLQRLHDAWQTERTDIDRTAHQMQDRLRSVADGPEEAASDAEAPRLNDAQREAACRELATRFDDRWGGFGSAPKFPPDSALALLLDEHRRTGSRKALEMATTTLDRMALGGIYDHVGGGFCRYSVDDEWLVPHFEKMLYNQALLVPIYLDAWLLTRKPLYRRVAGDTLDFVYRELTDPAGGFHSSLDADSEGVEGRFYVWTPDQVARLLEPDDAAWICATYGITPDGNFEGASIPNLLAGTPDGAAERAAPLFRRLLEARESRTRPATDDKVLTAWNGLMLSACARGHQVLGRQHDLDAAERAASFLEEHLHRDGRLLVTHRAGQSKLNAYLDDYAFLGRGLLDLYEAGFDTRWLDLSTTMSDAVIRHFEDSARGGFFFTSDDHESLLTRTRSLHDGALPSGAAVATEWLLRLAVHRDDAALRAAAERALEAIRPAVARMPSAYASWLLAIGQADPGPLELAVVGAPDDPRTRELVAAVRDVYLGRPAVQVGLPEKVDERERRALLRGRLALDGQPTAYVCRARACREPTRDAAELLRQLRG